MAHPSVVVWRNRLRNNSAARWLYQRWMANQAYEDAFGKALLAAIDGSSVIWDVGANVGLYTTQFLARGARHVVCFEPAPAAVCELRAKFEANARVHIVPVALAEATATAPFVADGVAPTNHLDSRGVGSSTGRTVDVPVHRGDDPWFENTLPAPTVVKIDVEGYEWEVLEGFGTLLRRRELRSVFVEMHFSILHERGLDDAPTAIVALLEDAGLAVQWLDLSHIAATRR